MLIVSSDSFFLCFLVEPCRGWLCSRRSSLAQAVRGRSFTPTENDFLMPNFGGRYICWADSFKTWNLKDVFLVLMLVVVLFPFLGNSKEGGDSDHAHFAQPARVKHVANSIPFCFCSDWLTAAATAVHSALPPARPSHPVPSHPKPGRNQPGLVEDEPVRTRQLWEAVLPLLHV